MSQPRSAERKRSRLSIDFIFDIETEDWDTFLVGCCFHLADGIHFISRDEKAFAEHMLAHVGTAWAHNGGRYDDLWLLRWIRRLGLECDVYETGARITLLKIGKLFIRDSIAVIPLKLADAVAIGNAHKLETGFICDLQCKSTRSTGKACGGFCRMHRNMSEDDWLKLESYCLNDCTSLGKTMPALQDYCDAKDLDLAGTIGSSSWRNARRRLGIPDAKWTAYQYRLAREGYYGGRTEVFRTHSAGGRLYDINSAYSAALSEVPVPVGTPTELSGDDAMGAFRSGVPGIYQAAVSVPLSCWIPPLPCRDSEGRLRFPIGTFTGAWTQVELEHAVTNGVSIERFGRALVWPEVSLALKAVVDYVSNLRFEVGKDSPIGKWLKWYLNALTGKFAQRPENRKTVMSPRNPRPCPGDGPCLAMLCGLKSIGCCEHRCIGTCGKMTMLGWNHDCWTVPEYRMPANGYVQWAAYLTAATRVKLHKRLLASTPIYCDTDSAPSETVCDRDVGEKLGLWLDEGGYADWEALAPKTYRYLAVGGKNDGKLVVKSKGIAEPDWDKMAAREPVVGSRGVSQFRTAVKKEDFFTKRLIYRQLKFDGIHFGSRVKIDPQSPLTYPTNIEGKREK